MLSARTEAMRPILHPQLVNGPFGDPCLYVEFLYEKRALLFDVGDLHLLPPRKILRISHIFVSHTHMDHFEGFDRIVRVCLGRKKGIRIFGPPGFLDQVERKLGAYTWNLVHNYDTDFHFRVTELHPNGKARTAEYHCRSAFRREGEKSARMNDGFLLDEETFRVRTAFLDHGIPSLAFLLSEKLHVNVWKNRVKEMGLPMGPWLRELKEAVVRGEEDEAAIRVWWREGKEVREKHLPLGLLKEKILRVVPGQRIAYVADAAYHEENARRILDLARGADLLFIEATFLQEDASRAARKRHLTAHQAGTLGRRAGVGRLTPFHFSPKYADREDRLWEEVERAFQAEEDPG